LAGKHWTMVGLPSSAAEIGKANYL